MTWVGTTSAFDSSYGHAGLSGRLQFKSAPTNRVKPIIVTFHGSICFVFLQLQFEYQNKQIQQHQMT